MAFDNFAQLTLPLRFHIAFFKEIASLKFDDLSDYGIVISAFFRIAHHGPHTFQPKLAARLQKG